MKDLSYHNALAVTALPSPSSDLSGVIVRLISDDKPYWCNGSAWIDLSATGSGSPAGSSGAVQYNDGGSFGGITNVSVDSGDVVFESNDSPSSPSASKVKLFGKNIGPSNCRVLPAIQESVGSSYFLQSSLWKRKIVRFNPLAYSTNTPTHDGTQTFGTTATVVARLQVTTSPLKRARRYGLTSTTAAGSMAGHSTSALTGTLCLGDGSGNGGFLYNCQFGVSDSSLQSAARMIVGLFISMSPGINIDPATISNLIGIGHKENDTNWFIYYGGSAAQSRIDLGSDFPINLTDLMNLTLISKPSENGVVHYEVTRYSNSGTFVTSGTLGPGTPGVTLPANSSFLGHKAWRTNNTAAVSIGMDIASIYYESEY